MGWGAGFIVITQGPRPVEEMPLETLPVAKPERKEVLERSHTDLYLFSPEVTPPNHWPMVVTWSSQWQGWAEHVILLCALKRGTTNICSLHLISVSCNSWMGHHV